MRPFDPRLLRYARSARGPIAVTALLGTFTALLVLAQALLISAALSPVVSGTASLTDVWPFIVGIAAVFACRALIVAAREAVSTRAAAAAVRELRGRVVDASVTLGPRWRATKGAETTTLLSSGLEDLRPYFVSFLPQLVLVCTVTPAALGVILLLDFWSALIALLVIPLIPIFMILIGRLTQAASEDKLASMKRLTAQLLDLMSGLPTLRGLGREKAPRTHLHALGAANTKATMATLRVAFLSGGVLEFLTTLSVALVAVEVGMRLVFGNISLFHGLAVIMLAPEVFDPLRQVGAQFHASANGVTASKAAFDIIEEAEAVARHGAHRHRSRWPRRACARRVGSGPDERRYRARRRDGPVRPLRRGEVDDRRVLAGRHDAGCRPSPATPLGLVPQERGVRPVGYRSRGLASPDLVGASIPHAGSGYDPGQHGRSAARRPERCGSGNRLR